MKETTPKSFNSNNIHLTENTSIHALQRKNWRQQPQGNVLVQQVTKREGRLLVTSILHADAGRSLLGDASIS